MHKNRILKSGILAGLVFTLALVVGCVPAENGESTGPSIIYLVVFVALMIGMFYFFMIRPMRQREKQHDRMVEELQRGDKVITAGGMYGEVDRVDEDSIVLIVESGAKIRVTKGGVVSRPEQ